MATDRQSTTERAGTDVFSLCRAGGLRLTPVPHFCLPPSALCPLPPPSTSPPLERAVRDVPDFPKPGILFKDIMPLLADPACFRLAIDTFVSICRDLPGGPPTKIVGIDARGFLFGAAVALRDGLGGDPRS